MEGAGLASAFDTSRLAVMGLGDAGRAVPAALSGAARLGRLARQERAAAAVLIDAWGFSRLAADRIKRASPGTRLVKLAGPQVWASRPGRARHVARTFDLTLTLLPFEPPLFEAEGGKAAFVGNPNFEAARAAPKDGRAFRARHGLGEVPLLVVLPGSRGGEVGRHMDVFGDACAGAAERVPGLLPVLVAAPAVEGLARELAARWTPAPLVVPGAERWDAFGAANAALAASGTVTTELAIAGVPTVVAYKVGRLTAAWIRRAAITPYASIVNVAAGEAVLPERLQEDCAPEQLCADIVRLLTDEGARRRQLKGTARALSQLLTKDDPASLAAEEVLRLLPSPVEAATDSL
jgi:lipid-A-disaccharide synthase